MRFPELEVGHAAARVHHASRRCGRRLAAYCGRAEIAAPDWVACVRRRHLRSNRSSLKDALAQAGLVDGSNIEIVFRYANGISDRLAELAAELVAQKPDLLLAVGGDVIKPLFEASKGSIYRNLASSLSGAGRIAEAKQAFAEVMLRYPDLTVSKFRQAMVVSPATMNRMAENLRKLGLPD